MTLRSPQLDSDMKSLVATVKTIPSKDTTRMAQVECKMHKLKVALGDSLDLFCGKSSATLKVQPGEHNPSKPRIGLVMEADSLFLKGMGSEMNTTLVYQAKRPEQGFAGFDFRLHNINIGKLVDLAPSLDTIVPMLRSFEGTVDFNMAAAAALDSNLNIKIPTLRSAIHVKGDSLVLMDGETFAEILKKFFFKNKKKNLIDSISANISIRDGKVTIYPFEVSMDRYKASVGGTQGLDMNFDYHISVPFIRLCK